MSIRSTNSGRTATPDLGVSKGLPVTRGDNDNLLWDRALFAQRVRELGDSSASNLLASLRQYCDTIGLALSSDLLDAAILDIVRADLAPVAEFVGFSCLSGMLLTVDVSDPLDRRRLVAAITAVGAACRHYCRESP